jgi:hypothetical protein
MSNKIGAIDEIRFQLRNIEYVSYVFCCAYRQYENELKEFEDDAVDALSHMNDAVDALTKLVDKLEKDGSK